MKVALIDYSISTSFRDALKEDVIPIYIENDDSFMSLKEKIDSTRNGELVEHIVIAQHYLPYLQIGSEHISFSDDTTWTGLRQFLIDMKNMGVISVDFLACFLYGEPGVPEMFMKLEEETGVDLRASTDDTGNIEAGGNWLLESDMIDIQNLYFTETIADFKELFFIAWWGGRQYRTSASIIGNQSAFAAIDASKNVYAWGNTTTGGFSGNRHTKLRIGNAISGEFLSNIESVYSTQTAFAAIDASKNVYAWGPSDSGGIATSFATQIRIGNATTGAFLSNIESIYSTNTAFAVIDVSKNVYVWGAGSSGGIATTFATQVRIGNATTGDFLSNIESIYSTSAAFAVIDIFKNVYAWGSSGSGGIASSFATQIRIGNATTGAFLSNIESIYSTNNAFAVIDVSKNVYVWGAVSFGGIATTFATQVRIGNATTGDFLSNIESIYSTEFAFAAIDASKNIYAWGSTSYAGVGSPSFATQLRINDAITGTFLSNIENVYSTSRSFAVIDASKNVYAWGSSTYGGVGSASFATQVRIGNATSGSFLSNIESIYSNQFAFAVIDGSKNVYAWGSTLNGGVGSTSFATQLRIENATFGPFLSNIESIYSTNIAFAVIDVSKNVYAWGNTTSGGVGSASFATQVRIENATIGEFLLNIESIYSTEAAFAVVNTSKNVYAWGNTTSGGMESTSFATQVHIVDLTSGEFLSNIESVYSTTSAFAVINNSKNVCAWGASSSGGIATTFSSQLRIGNAISGPFLSNIKSAHSNQSAFAVIDVSKNVYAWGSSDSGGIITYFTTQVRIGNATSGPFLSNIESIYSTNTAFAAIDASKNVYAWGNTTTGGFATLFATRVRIGNSTSGPFLSNIESICSTNAAFAVIDISKNVYAWGPVGSGGISSSFATQLRIENATTGAFLSNIESIYSNQSAFVAIDASKNVYVWGSSSSGGIATTFATQVRIGNATTGDFLSNIESIYSTESAFAAIDASKNIYAWGSTDYGGVESSSFATQLRINDAITGTFLSNIENVYSTLRAFAVIDASKNVYAWGATAYAGVGSTSFATQVRIENATSGSFLSNIESIYSNPFAFAVIDGSKNVYVWGGSSSGGIAISFATQVRIGNATSGPFLSNIESVCSNNATFAVIDAFKNVYAWGNTTSGGVGSASFATQVRIENASSGPFLSNIESIYSTSAAFAAIDASKNVYAWGNTTTGGVEASNYASLITMYSETNVLKSAITFAELPLIAAIVNATKLTINPNESTTLSASITGGIEPFTYQWLLNGNEISGATSATYTIAGHSETSLTTKQYSCRVIDSTNASSTSSAITITFSKPPIIINAITATKLNIYPNESTTLSVSFADGYEPFTYQWLLNGNEISGATSATYTIAGHSETSLTTKQYSCRVIDSTNASSTSSAITITFLIHNTTFVPEDSFISIMDIENNLKGIISSVSSGITVNPPLTSGSFTLEANGVTPPAGVVKTYLEIKQSSINIPGVEEVVEFIVDKFDANNDPVQSILGNASTYSTIIFNLDISKSFIIVWGGSTPSTRTVFYDGLNNTIQYYGTNNTTLQETSPYDIMLLNNGVVENKISFSYIGPNSSTYMLIIPSSLSLIPCFVSGTRILTPTGEKLIENLCTGDAVLTADGRKVFATIYTTKIAKTTNETAPYLIPANAFRPHFPPQDITLSPKHAIQSSKNTWEIPQFAEKRFPVIKKTRIGEAVTYYHIELPNFFTDNLIANGSVCESLGSKVQKMLPKGKALYTFNKKLGGFIRYNPMSVITKKLNNA
jgi:alpha-tubulin suppressor-like RCC1 family protein